jgi:hypothetical protein
MEFSEISSPEATSERALFEKILLSNIEWSRSSDDIMTRLSRVQQFYQCENMLQSFTFLQLHEMILLE